MVLCMRSIQITLVITNKSVDNCSYQTRKNSIFGHLLCSVFRFSFTFVESNVWLKLVRKSLHAVNVEIKRTHKKFTEGVLENFYIKRSQEWKNIAIDPIFTE